MIRVGVRFRVRVGVRVRVRVRVRVSSLQRELPQQGGWVAAN